MKYLGSTPSEVTLTDTQTLTNKDLSSVTNNLGLKTINGSSIRGSGDLTVSASASTTAATSLTLYQMFGIL